MQFMMKVLNTTTKLRYSKLVRSPATILHENAIVSKNILLHMLLCCVN